MGPFFVPDFTSQINICWEMKFPKVILEFFEETFGKVMIGIGLMSYLGSFFQKKSSCFTSLSLLFSQAFELEEFGPFGQNRPGIA